MRRYPKKAFVLLGLALCTAILAEAAQPFKLRGSPVRPNWPMSSNSRAAAENVQYNLIEITGPAGSTNLFAVDITNGGIVSGYYTPPGAPGEVRTFFFEKGVFTDLQHPDYPLVPINSLVMTNNGRQYGNWGTLTSQVPGFRNPKTNEWTALPPYAPEMPTHYVWRMNESGLSVGDSCTGVFNAPALCVGWKWDTQHPGYQAAANPDAVLLGINNRGQIVGFTQPDMLAYLEYQGKYVLLSDRPSIAWDINDAGEILITFLDSGENAIVHGKELHILPAPEGSVMTIYEGMNDRGDLAGNWIDALGSSHALVATRKLM